MKLGKLMLIMACTVTLSACDSDKSGSVFSAQYSAAQANFNVAAGGAFKVPLTLKNSSQGSWDSKDAKSPVGVSYHLLDSDKKVVVFDGLRTWFSEPVAPGKDVAIKLEAVAPTQPGTYTLQVSLVQEYVAWFDGKEVKPLELTLNVK